MRRNHTPNLRAPPAAPEAPLSKSERAELQRQGAKAAARGEPSDSNPLTQPLNRPAATGESADKWLQRSDAWEQGHEAQAAEQQDAWQPVLPGDGDEHD